MVYKTIRVVNNCAFPVWPATVGSTDLPPQMKKVRAGESYSWKADPFWSGSIWGRTGCVFNSQGLGGCDSDDCGGNLQCMNKFKGQQFALEFIKQRPIQRTPERKARHSQIQPNRGIIGKSRQMEQFPAYGV